MISTYKKSVFYPHASVQRKASNLMALNRARAAEYLRKARATDLYIHLLQIAKGNNISRACLWDYCKTVCDGWASFYSDPDFFEFQIGYSPRNIGSPHTQNRKALACAIGYSDGCALYRV